MDPIRITIEGPGMNALGSELMSHLTEQLEHAGGRPVLLTGAGRAFSAGLNLKELLTLDEAGMEAFLTRLLGLVRTLYLYPGPTLALVNGHAIAGGCILALCCDRALMIDDPRARVGLNEVALGLRFPPLMLRLFRQRLPTTIEEVILGSALHGPADALRLRLVHRLVSAEGAEAAALAELKALGAHPATAYAAAIHALRAESMVMDEAEERQFQQEVVPVWASETLKARIRAVLGG